nr:PC-esterase domain-containing protein 1B-like [Dermacentor andersoni]
MPYVFTSECVRSLLRTKRLAFMGCSNVRAVYKDLVCLYQENSLISNDLLKQKMEESCLGDYLVDHGKQSGQGYLEERIFCNDHTTIYFYFLTKIYSDYVQTVLVRMADISPDVVIVSSCLWDITRWGPCGVGEYKKNLHLFFGGLRSVLPQSSIAIWLTAAPPSQNVHSGFLFVPELDFLKYSLRLHVIEANYFCRE